MATDEKFQFDSIQDPESISDFLNALTEGFGKGRIILSADNEEMLLNPGSLLQFSVKAKKKAGTNKLQIKVAWKDEKKSTSDTSRTINISS